MYTEWTTEFSPMPNDPVREACTLWQEAYHALVPGCPELTFTRLHNFPNALVVERYTTSYLLEFQTDEWFTPGDFHHEMNKLMADPTFDHSIQVFFDTDPENGYRLFFRRMPKGTLVNPSEVAVTVADHDEYHNMKGA